MESPPVFELAVDWYKQHLAALNQATEERKPTPSARGEQLDSHNWKRGVAAPGNTAAVKTVAVEKKCECVIA